MDYKPREFEVGKTCNYGHYLHFISVQKQRQSFGFPLVAQSLSCNKCNAGIQDVTQGYYTCDYQCDYDLCKGCFEGEYVNHLIHVPGQHVVGITCNRGKPLKPRDITRADGIEDATCNICHEEFNVTQGVFVCEDADNGCNYDCCPRCFKGNVVGKGKKICSEGFPLIKRTSKRTRYLGYAANCDVCKQRINDVRNGYYVCNNADSHCNFDCCEGCFNG
jgi:hypothetical protein